MRYPEPSDRLLPAHCAVLVCLAIGGFFLYTSTQQSVLRPLFVFLAATLATGWAVAAWSPAAREPSTYLSLVLLAAVCVPILISVLLIELNYWHPVIALQLQISSAFALLLLRLVLQLRHAGATSSRNGNTLTADP